MCAPVWRTPLCLHCLGCTVIHSFTCWAAGESTTHNVVDPFKVGSSFFEQGDLLAHASPVRGTPAEEWTPNLSWADHPLGRPALPVQVRDPVHWMGPVSGGCQRFLSSVMVFIVNVTAYFEKTESHPPSSYIQFKWSNYPHLEDLILLPCTLDT